MKLTIKRNQADVKGSLGDTTFELVAKIECTSEEFGFVSKYKAHISKSLSEGEAFMYHVYIDKLMAGNTFKGKTISDALAHEKNAKGFFEDFKNYIEAMKNFGGEKVLEI